MGAATSKANESTLNRDQPSACPVQHGQSLNNIPSDLGNTRTGKLSTERTLSTIPRSRSDSTTSNSTLPSECPVAHLKPTGPTAATTADDAHWVYPSPQQFQNALTRKGKQAPEESVAMMVSIHNFLNERAWQEVRRWEDQRVGSDQGNVELARFTGRPNELSPKARFHMTLAKLFPTTYSDEPPFDRHDWYIRRPLTNAVQRYVIDYYSCPDDEQGNPVFSLDVRPAVDNFAAVRERLAEWARVKKERWWTTGATGMHSVPA